MSVINLYNFNKIILICVNSDFLLINLVLCLEVGFLHMFIYVKLKCLTHYAHRSARDRGWLVGYIKVSSMGLMSFTIKFIVV